MSEVKKCLTEEVCDGEFTYTKLIYTFFIGNASKRSVLLYRLGKYCHDEGYTLLSKYFYNRIQKDYGIYINKAANIEKGLHFPHPTSIVIGEGVRIGENTTIYQNVTLGGARRGDWQNNNYPTIQDNVVIFAGAVIIGKVNIGENCTIGANSVVNKCINANLVVAGIPAKVINVKVINEN